MSAPVDVASRPIADADVDAPAALSAPDEKHTPGRASRLGPSDVRARLGDVHPDARSRGAGSSIVEAAERRAAEAGAGRLQYGVLEGDARGVNRVSLGVDAQNPTGATKLDERVGMQTQAETITFEKALA